MYIDRYVIAKSMYIYRIREFLHSICVYRIQLLFVIKIQNTNTLNLYPCEHGADAGNDNAALSSLISISRC